MRDIAVLKAGSFIDLDAFVSSLLGSEMVASAKLECGKAVIVENSGGGIRL
jgi:hypothetical protein